MVTIPHRHSWKQCLPNGRAVGAVFNRTGLECLINSKIYYSCCALGKEQEVVTTFGNFQKEMTV